MRYCRFRFVEQCTLVVSLPSSTRRRSSHAFASHSFVSDSAQCVFPSRFDELLTLQPLSCRLVVARTLPHGLLSSLSSLLTRRHPRRASAQADQLLLCSPSLCTLLLAPPRSSHGRQRNGRSSGSHAAGARRPSRAGRRGRRRAVHGRVAAGDGASWAGLPQGGRLERGGHQPRACVFNPLVQTAFIRTESEH